MEKEGFVFSDAVRQHILQQPGMLQASAGVLRLPKAHMTACSWASVS